MNARAPTPRPTTTPCLTMVATNGSICSVTPLLAHERSIGLTWVCWGGIDNPHRARLVVGQVPDTPAGGDLHLPLFEGAPFERTGRQAAAKLVVGFVLWWPRIHPHKLERRTRVCGCLRAEFVPPLRGLARAEPDLPLALKGRWGYTVQTLWAHSGSATLASP